MYACVCTCVFTFGALGQRAWTKLAGLARLENGLTADERSGSFPKFPKGPCERRSILLVDHKKDMDPIS